MGESTWNDKSDTRVCERIMNRENINNENYLLLMFKQDLCQEEEGA